MHASTLHSEAHLYAPTPILQQSAGPLTLVQLLAMHAGKQLYLHIFILTAMRAVVCVPSVMRGTSVYCHSDTLAEPDHVAASKACISHWMRRMYAWHDPLLIHSQCTAYCKRTTSWISGSAEGS